MKRLLIVLAVLVLLLSGCSANNEIFWGEAIESDGWEFTITNIEYRESYSLYNRIHKPDNGSIFIEVEYSVKNISKTERYFNPESSMLQIDYDGYIFDHEEGYWLATSGWVQNSENLKPLSDALKAKMYFEVPTEAKENTEKELKIVVNLADTYFCSINPLHENSLQGKYDKAIKQIEDGQYDSAIKKLEELGEYNDSKQKLETAIEKQRFQMAAFNENIEYFSKNKEKYAKISANQISDLTNYSWDFSKYGNPVKFKENGELYNSYIAYENIHWVIENDCLVINYKKYGRTETFEIRQFEQGKYLLYLGEEFQYTLERTF